MDRRRAQATDDAIDRGIARHDRAVRSAEWYVQAAWQLRATAGGDTRDGGAARVRPGDGEPGGARQCHTADALAAGAWAIGRLRLAAVWAAVAAAASSSGRGDRMTPPVTLSIYIARQFIGAVIGMLLALSGLVAMFDFIELLRRSVLRPDATFAVVSEIAALRLPYIAIQVMPF